MGDFPQLLKLESVDEPAIDQGLVLPSCGILGLSIGGVLARGLQHAFSLKKPILIISPAMSIGLILSLLAIILKAVFSILVIWQIAFLSFVIMCFLMADKLWPTDIRSGAILLRRSFSWTDVLYLPFFVAMGGFWAFIEILGRQISVPFLETLLLASLVFSAFGSAIPSAIATNRTAHWSLISLIVSAVTGAAVYLTSSGVTFAIMLLANSFFLFVFLPLYLAGNSSSKQQSSPQIKAALYLLGLALGGAMGGLILAEYGHTIFAIAIFATVVPAMVALWLQPKIDN